MSKIETFIKENNLTLELEINKDFTIATLYGKGDLCLMCFKDASMNEAINKAVNHYREKINGHSTE